MTGILTVGHSTHTIEHFLSLLHSNGVTAIADVRSSPYSRHTPQYNREELKAALRDTGISYAFLGDALGARSDDPAHYDGNRVQYARVAESAKFGDGIDRVLAGAKTHRIALMCAEKDPLTCHRTILVSRRLIERGADIAHVTATGAIETHDAAMERLMGMLDIDSHDLFATPEELRARAYREQEARIAYVRSDPAVAAE
jgi:uncharacterized protein (DUF488 family)